MDIITVGFVLHGLCILLISGQGHAYSMGVELGSCDLSIANVFDLLFKPAYTLCIAWP